MLDRSADPSYDKIPNEVFESLQLYVEHRICPGDGLLALLENDFARALTCSYFGDVEVYRALARFFFNRLPAACWGDPKKVDAWLSGKKTKRKR